MDPNNLGRDEHNEDLVMDMIRDNDADIGSYLNDSGEGMANPDPHFYLDDFDDVLDQPEGEADGSGSNRDIICTSTTQSGAVYSLSLSAD
jgi:hypothetical protein